MLTKTLWRSLKANKLDPNLCQVVSLSLQYPDSDLLAMEGRMRLAVSCLPGGAARDALGQFLGWWKATPPMQVQSHYVEMFDMAGGCSLFLTAYLKNDSERTSEALAEINARYRIAGLDLMTGHEMADHFAVILEYAAMDPAGGARLLRELRPAVELVRQRLHGAHSPYALPVDALREHLPRMGPAHQSELSMIAAEEPLGGQDG